MRKTPTEHQFKKGTSGNPKGRPPGVLKELRSVMINVLSETDQDGRQAIERIVRKLTDKAIKGDLASAQVIFDRVYGRVSHGHDFHVGIDPEFLKIYEEFKHTFHETGQGVTGESTAE